MNHDVPERRTPTPGHGAGLMSTPSLVALEVVGGGLAGWLAAAAATVAILVFWGLLMAPKAKRRLASTPRLVVSAALCLGTAYGLIAVGHPWWGWFVGIAGIAVVAAQVALPQADPEHA